MKIFLDILYSFGILIAISIISGFIPQKFKKDNIIKILQGILYGTATLIGMLNPVIIRPGLIFDGRSIMISLVAVFYGPIAGIISAGMASALRIYQGGVGLRMGVLVIFLSALIGIIFYYKWTKKNKDLSIKNIYFFSIIVHLAMLASTIALPTERILQTLSTIWFSVLMAYPLATIIIGKIILDSNLHNKALSDLKNREEQLRSISNNFTNGMIYQVLVNKDGTRNFKYLSDSVKLLYGISPEQGLEDSSLIYNCLYREDIKKLADLEEKAIKKFSIFKAEVRILKPDGEIRWSSLVSRPKMIEGGLVLWDGMEFDITELKKTEEDLINSKLKLEEANMAKSQFLANMSHEIRTPMNGIIGMGEILSNTELSDDQKKYVKNINISANNLLNIINDILDISKIEAGKKNIDIKYFNIQEMIESIISNIIYSANKKGLKIDVAIDKDISRIIESDEGKIRQILLNLLSNAVKFTNKGSIFLSIEKRSKSEIECDLIFKVKDTGIGIDKEFEKNIFSPFAQGESGFTKKYQGTGLGLTISKKLVELLGGDIDFKTEKDKGSEFYFNIPIKFGKNKDEKIAPKIIIKNEKQIENISNKKKIMVAEDNIINMLVTIKMLSKIGNYEIIEAKDGKEAIEKFLIEKPELILMDIQMPIINGVEAFHSIKKIATEKDHNVKVIALTAYASPEDKKNFIDIGMDAYLSKPFSIEKLSEILLLDLK